MLPLPLTARDIRILLENLDDSDNDGAYQALCECIDYGVEGTLLVLKTLFHELEAYEKDLKDMQFKPIFRSIAKHILDSPNFSEVVMCEAVSRRAWTDDFLDNLCISLQLSLPEGIGLGLILLDAKDIMIRTCAKKFVMAQIAQMCICTNHAYLLSLDQIQNILICVTRSEGLHKHLDKLIHMISVVLVKVYNLMIAPLLCDASSEINFLRISDVLEDRPSSYSRFWTALDVSSSYDLQLSDSWKSEMLMELLNHLAHGICSTNVFENLEHETIHIRSDAAFSVFLSTIRQAWQNPSPVKAVSGSAWMNAEGEISSSLLEVSRLAPCASQELSNSEMVPDLINLILIRCDVRTIANFAVSSQFCYSFTRTWEFMRNHWNHQNQYIIDSLLVFEKTSEATRYALLHGAIEANPLIFPHKSVLHKLNECSSAGLLLLSDSDAESTEFALWNPACNKIRILPIYNLEVEEDCTLLDYFPGIGMDYSLLDLKVVVIWNICKEDSVNDIGSYPTSVFSWNNQGWHDVDGPPPILDFRSKSHSFDGYLYWTCARSCDKSPGCEERILLLFDLSNERFGTKPLPPTTSVDSFDLVQRLNNELCFIEVLEGESGIRDIRIWALENSAWSFRYQVAPFPGLSSVIGFRNDGVLFLVVGGRIVAYENGVGRVCENFEFDERAVAVGAFFIKETLFPFYRMD